jgi:hypothetical protein
LLWWLVGLLPWLLLMPDSSQAPHHSVFMLAACSGKPQGATAAFSAVHPPACCACLIETRCWLLEPAWLRWLLDSETPCRLLRKYAWLRCQLDLNNQAGCLKTMSNACAWTPLWFRKVRLLEGDRLAAFLEI